MFRRVAAPLAVVLCFTAFAIVRGEDKADDLSFDLQGEYAGGVVAPMGNSDIGVQVVSEGEGKFRAVTTIGGLPGDGWDRTPRITGNGELKGEEIQFNGQGGGSAVVDKKGVFSITIAGVKVGDLRKQDRQSPTLGAPAPAGAIVLFDGSGTDNFEKGEMEATGLLKPGATTKEKLGSGKLHVEFRVPYTPKARGQDRGNSGVLVQGRYEIHILDSFGDDESETGCAAIYGVRAPDQNMSYPPMSWQTFDIDFTAPEAAGGEAMLTVRHNGILVERKAKISAPTKDAPVAAGIDPAPLTLVDRGSEVRFQNIWFAPKVAEEKK